METQFFLWNPKVPTSRDGEGEWNKLQQKNFFFKRYKWYILEFKFLLAYKHKNVGVGQSYNAVLLKISDVAYRQEIFPNVPQTRTQPIESKFMHSFHFQSSSYLLYCITASKKNNNKDFMHSHFYFSCYIFIMIIWN